MSQEAEIEAVASAIRQQRNGTITPPSEGTDYDRRLAVAAIDALRRVTQLPEDVKGLVDELRHEAKAFKGPCLYQRLLTSSADALVAANKRAAEAKEGWHLANGVADLAMKHRDEAEARVAVLETPISMDDVRLFAGEGKLSAHDMLNAVNALIRQKAAGAYVPRALSTVAGEEKP